MASTYSPSLKLTLMGDGDQAGLWGQTTNTNLGTLLEQAITGVQSIVMADANYTLTNFNGITNEARNAVLVVTGTNNAVRDLIPPVVEKLYTIVNNTTGGYAIRVIGSSGTGVNIPNGVTTLVYCDGTNFYAGNTGTSGNFIVNGTLTATTANATTVNATTVTATTVNATNATFSGAISSVSPAFTGTPTAPTATVGTNTTQIATTAFVLANNTPVGGAGGFVSVQYFTTAGAITWTRPSGIKKIYVYVIGGGGGGRQSGTQATCGGGGGGCAIKLIDVTSISSISGNVGSGGAVNVAGSPSIFNTTIIGGGGGVGNESGGYPVGGTGGSASGGDLNIPGGTASANSYSSVSSGTPGGTPAFFGQAGPGGGYSGSQGNGLYGGGGGGNGYSSSAGAGGDGIIVVYEYS
jgi:hypothetical protein